MKHRSCFSVQQLLSLRPADWDDDERRQVVAHLATCTQCEKLSRVYAAQDRALHHRTRRHVGISDFGHTTVVGTL